MRRIRYGIGMSLDGFIANTRDETDWMPAEPTYDSRPFFASIDTVLIGRRSYEVMLRHGMRSYPGLRTFVFSHTLDPRKYPEITVLADDGIEALAELRRQPGLDIWLSGGGELFRSLLEADLVDTIEVGVSPALLGEGRSFLPSMTRMRRLELTHHQAFPNGLVVLHYEIKREPSASSAVSARAAR